MTCGTQLPWAKENLLEQTKQLAKEHPECHFFVTLGDGAKDFSEEEVAPNVTLVSYLPYKEFCEGCESKKLKIAVGARIRAREGALFSLPDVR